MTPPPLTPGSTFAHAFGPVSLPDIVRYAGASGDFNPSHYDRDLAVRSGFKTNFAQGMFTAGLLGVFVGELFGAERVRGFGVRFAAPLWCDDAPRIEASVVSVADGIARLKLAVLVDDRNVVDGWADVIIEGEQTT